jgi:O-antigen/teichoic acid export membrane protein
MRGLFGRDSLYVLIWGLQVGVAALSIPVTTRLLGRNFGVVTTAFAVMQILVPLCSFSLSTSVQRAYRADGGARDARRTITLMFVTAGITLAIATATRPYWIGLLRLDRNARIAVEYAIVWAALSALTNAGLAFIRSANKLLAFVVVSLIQSVIAVIASVALIVLVRRTPAEFVLGQLLSQAPAAALALAVARPLPIRVRDLPLMRRALGYSAGLVPASLATFLMSSSDRIVIRHDLPIIQASRYGAVYNLAAIPILLLGSLDSIWLPRFFAMAESSTLSTLVASSRDALYQLLIPVILGLSFGLPLVLAVWVPRSYDPAGLYLVVATISVSGFAVVGWSAANRVLLLAGNTRPVGLCMVIAAIFNVAANVVLDPVIGLEGAALSTLLAYVLLHALTLRFAHRARPLRRPPLRLALYCAATVISAAACSAMPASGAFVIVRSATTLVCLAGFAATLRAVVGSGRRRVVSGATSAS